MEEKKGKESGNNKINEILKIDGSMFSGGGQMLRTALALSIMTQKPFEMFNIRAKRPNPGLKKQHLYCIKGLLRLSRSKAENVFLGSDRIRFFPGKFKGGSLRLDVETAGSITLVLQALMLPMVFLARTRVRIVGGTDVKWSPTIDYFNHVLCYYFRFFADINVSVVKRGYYPKGGGVVEVLTKPRVKVEEAMPIDLVRNNETRLSDINILGVSHASKDLMKRRVAERQAISAESHILKNLGVKPRIRVEYSNSESTGSGICLWASAPSDQTPSKNQGFDIVLGSDALGEKGVSAESVGRSVASKLVDELNSFGMNNHFIRELGVDSLLADQLVPLIGLVGGALRTSRITDHVISNVHITNLFLNNALEIRGNIIINKKKH